MKLNKNLKVWYCCTKLFLWVICWAHYAKWLCSLYLTLVQKKFKKIKLVTYYDGTSDLTPHLLLSTPFALREQRERWRNRENRSPKPSEQYMARLKPPFNLHFSSLKIWKPYATDFSHFTLCVDIYFDKKMVRSRGGKTMSESSSKEQTYSTSSPLSVRRTRRSSTEENTS